MDYPLSYGIGPEGGFTSNAMPDMSYLDGTPTLGVFQGGGMDPMMALALSQAIGNVFTAGSPQLRTPNLLLPAPQALLSPGIQSRQQMLAAALNRYSQY